MQSSSSAAGANALKQQGVPACGAGGLDFSDVQDLLLGSQSAGPESFEPMLKGDPYPQEDDVVRGCVLPSGPGGLGDDLGCGAPAFGDWFFGLEPGRLEVDMCRSLEACEDPPFSYLLDKGHTRDMKPRIEDVFFSETAEPRELPFGMHEATSIYIEGRSPAQAAACAYAFLTQEVMSSIQQVKPEKFVIKAEVFDEEGGCLSHCALKAKVLRVPQPSGGGRRLLVEFQRRRGDPLVFARIFGRAKRYILDRLSAAGAPEGDRAILKAPPAPPAAPAAELELQPLVDMLTDSSLPEAQAEAVTALVAVATASAAGAIAVCAAVSQVQHVIAALVASKCLDVAYPAARLAAMLARHGDAELSGALMLAARDGARFAGTDSLVRSELVKACSPP